MIQATRLPIVLCCAEESEVALVAVVDALHREGHAPEVVPGVETDATLVTTAADRVRGPALFVLCQSADLDRVQVRRLEGLFSARRGPDHRMITVEVAQRSTAAIVTEVRAAARDLGRSLGAGGRDDDDGRYMRDVVTPTSMAAVPGAAPSDRGPSRGPIDRSRSTPRSSPVPAPIAQAPEGISDEALGLDSGEVEAEADTEIVDPLDLHRRSVPPEPDVQLATNPSARAALEAAGYATGRATGGATRGAMGGAVESPESDGVPLAVPEDFPMVGESSEDLEIRGAPGRVGWDHSGPVDIERVARPSRTDPRAEADDTPLPSASSPIEVGRPTPSPTVVNPEPAPRERRGARVLLLLFAIAGMGAVVTMAVLHATAPSGGPSDVQQRGIPTTEPAPKGEPTPTTKAEPPPPRVVPPVDPSQPKESGPEPVVGTQGDASTGADASGSTGGSDSAAPDDDAAPPEPGDDGPPSDEPGDGEVVPKLVPPPPTSGSGVAGEDSLEAAIADGRVRELGDLLVVTTGPSTVTWDEADARCSRRKVASLRNWRLPTKGQLGELRRAKLLGPGSYWSRSTVGEDEAFVVEAGSGEAAQWLKMEPNGRVVCVRPRP